MRTCPKCKKKELDVTAVPNNYRCWNCGYFCIGRKNLLKAYKKAGMEEDPIILFKIR